jgi:hypothetical protein
MKLKEKAIGVLLVMPCIALGFFFSYWIIDDLIEINRMVTARFTLVPFDPEFFSFRVELASFCFLAPFIMNRALQYAKGEPYLAGFYTALCLLATTALVSYPAYISIKISFEYFFKKADLYLCEDALAVAKFEKNCPSNK